MTDPWRGRHGLFLLFIVLAGFAAYGPSLGTYFIKDDLSMSMFSDQAGRFDVDSWFHQLIWPTARTWDDIWRPVPALTWAFDFLVFGADPVAFHLGNVLAHAFNGVLLYWLVNRLTRFTTPLAGFFAAMLFELYPLHLEAILWSTQRTVVFGLMFSLLAVLAYDVWLHRRRGGAFVLAWVAFTLAILSREHGAALPAVFGFMALVLGPPQPWRRRLGDAARVAAIGAVVLAAYFGCRILIWGRPYGGYSGWPTMDAYARDHQVIESLPTTLRMLAVPDNRCHFDRPAWEAVGLTFDHLVVAFQVVVAAVALVTVARGLRRSWAPAAFGGLALLLSVTAWLPVRLVFKVAPSLLNARSGYHLIAPIVAFVGAALASPWTRGPLPRWRVAFAGVTMLAYAGVLQVNLVSYDHGGRQVRELQEAVVREADAHGRDTVVVVFDVPTEYLGCPTLDAYLPYAVRPPYVREPVDVVALVAGLDSRWPAQIDGPEGVGAARSRGRTGGGLRPVLYFQATPDGPPLRPLFGGPEAARGDEPVVLESPDDGLIRRASGPEPVFRFRPPEGRRRFVLHLNVPGGLALRLPLEAGGSARRAGNGAVEAPLSAAAPEGHPAPLAWPLLAGFANPYPVEWRVETVDDQGASTGISERRRLLILEDRFDGAGQ